MILLKVAKIQDIELQSSLQTVRSRRKKNQRSVLLRQNGFLNARKYVLVYSVATNRSLIIWVLLVGNEDSVLVSHMYLFLTYSLYISMSSLHSTLTWP